MCYIRVAQYYQGKLLHRRFSLKDRKGRPSPHHSNHTGKTEGSGLSWPSRCYRWSQVVTKPCFPNWGTGILVEMQQEPGTPKDTGEASSSYWDTTCTPIIFNLIFIFYAKFFKWQYKMLICKLRVEQVTRSWATCKQERCLIQGLMLRPKALPLGFMASADRLQQV